MVNHLRSRLGFGGYSFAFQTPDLASVTFSGGAGVATADSLWWMDSYRVPSGGNVTWRNRDHPTGSILADHAGIYYIASPDGGTFSLSLSSNGGPWSLLADIPAVDVGPQGRYTNFALPPGWYKLSVTGKRGVNRILGPELLRSGNGGVRSIFLARDGANLSGILSTPAEVFRPILRSLRPTWINWHMKERADIGSETLSNRLEEW